MEPGLSAPPRAAVTIEDEADMLMPLHTHTPRTPGGSGVSRLGTPTSPFAGLPPAQTPRLQLVLDIDNTMLCAAEAPAASEARPPENVFSFTLCKHSSGATSRYNVRLRDGLHAFLRALQDFADVHIYTMGAKSYIREVLNAIDPDIELIKGRVLCREDGMTETFIKSLTHLQSDTEARAAPCSRPAATLPGRDSASPARAPAFAGSKALSLSLLRRWRHTLWWTTGPTCGTKSRSPSSSR